MELNKRINLDRVKYIQDITMSIIGFVIDTLKILSSLEKTNLVGVRKTVRVSIKSKFFDIQPTHDFFLLVCEFLSN